MDKDGLFERAVINRFSSEKELVKEEERHLSDTVAGLVKRMPNPFKK